MKNIEKKDYNILGACVKTKCYLKGNAMRQQIEYKDDEIEIDIKDLLFEIIGHWKIILTSTLLVAIIAFVISAFVSNVDFTEHPLIMCRNFLTCPLYYCKMYFRVSLFLTFVF